MIEDQDQKWVLLGVMYLLYLLHERRGNKATDPRGTVY